MDAKPRRTRLYVFPGGVLEKADYGDDGCGGFFIEFHINSLPQRISSTADVPLPIRTIEPADAETCARVLRLLRPL
jgi:hypothetical protein